MDISKVNETFFEQQMIYKNKSISTMDNEAKKMETNDLFFNKLNAPRTESLMTIIKGNYPDATEAERYESEVSIYSFKIDLMMISIILNLFFLIFLIG